MTKPNDGIRLPSTSRDLLPKTRRRREGFRDRVEAGRFKPPRRNDLRPDLKLVDRPVAALRPASRRVRKEDPAHVARIANAIATLGFSVPLLITAEDEIIDGHDRLEAAKQLGLEDVPCVVIGHLDAEEIRLLRIASNRLAEGGTWDFEALRLEFEELIVLDAPATITGFDAPEIDIILADDEPETHESGPIEPEPYADRVAPAVRPAAAARWLDSQTTAGSGGLIGAARRSPAPSGSRR